MYIIIITTCVTTGRRLEKQNSYDSELRGYSGSEGPDKAQQKTLKCESN